jgi:outer membrane protein assembly factor BamB
MNVSNLQLTILVLCLFFLGAADFAAGQEKRTVETDWPKWRGPRGDGTWQGPELPDKLATKLPVQWQAQIGGGYAGVIIADGRCLVFDKVGAPKGKTPAKQDSGSDAEKNAQQELERLHCFDALTGATRWTHQYEQAYGDLDYGNGPRATPTVHGDRVYVLGALGKLYCLNLDSGKPIWSKDLVKDFNGRPPMWGYAASPMVYESNDSDKKDVLIVVGGGANGFGVLALDLDTGQLQWNSLNDEAGYSWPVVARRKSGDQLVYWSPTHIRGLAAKTGKPLWEIPYKITYGVAIATPIVHNDVALVCGYWAGSRAIKLTDDPSNTKLLWQENKFLRGLMSQPLYRDGLVYLLDKQYGLTCFEFATGKKLWDDKNQVTPRARNPQASLVWAGDDDRILALNSEGELVMGKCNKSGFTELSRSKIIGPTWAHPAYSGNRVYARDDSQVVCVKLVE